MATEIHITDEDIQIKYVRHPDDPFKWDTHVLGRDGTWSKPIDLDTTGKDVLWGCTALCMPSSIWNEGSV